MGKEEKRRLVMKYYSLNGRRKTAEIIGVSERWIKRCSSELGLKIDPIVKSRNMSEGIKKAYANKDVSGSNNPAYGLKRKDLAVFNKSRAGIPLSKETKEKIAESIRRQFGNYTGSNKQLYPRPSKYIKQKIINTKGRLCENCGYTKNLQIDHIQPVCIRPDLAKDPTNMRVLCVDCHKATDTYGGKMARIRRKEWQKNLLKNQLLSL